VPEFKKVVPVLKVVDMPQSLDFYSRILGSQVCWRQPNDGGGENCMLQAGATELLLSATPREAPRQLRNEEPKTENRE
jgi:hypothetical protein